MSEAIETTQVIEIPEPVPVPIPVVIRKSYCPFASTSVQSFATNFTFGFVFGVGLATLGGVIGGAIYHKFYR